MANLNAGKGEYHVDLVVFDKDGTLIDLNHIWGTRARAGVMALAAAAGDESLAQGLGDALGLHVASATAVPDGPLAVTTMSKLYTICAAVLYQGGFSWEKAEALAMDHFAPKMLAPPTPEQIQPLADILGLFQKLQSAGVKIAVATSDDRSLTVSTLDIMGVTQLVDEIVCGDDDLPNKPSPAAMELICHRLEIPPSRTMMVGDTVSDMMFGRNAGVACCVGIVTDDQDPRALSAHAHEIISHVGLIKLSSSAAA